MGRRGQTKRLNRREALKALSAGLAASIPVLAGAESLRPAERVLAETYLPAPHAARLACRPAPGSRPNLVVVVTDNQHYQAMGCAGHPFLQTPALDRLAGEGVLFENAFCTTALCSPSRASLLTGVYARRHAVLNNHTPWSGAQTTFLELLSRAGYATAFIGKWHMPGKGLPDLPCLDRFVSFTYREGQGAYYNCPLIVDGQEIPGGKIYLSTLLTDYAIAFIQNIAQQNAAAASFEQRPFCLYLAHRTSHPPYQAPPEISGMYRQNDVSAALPPQVDPWWYGKANRNIFEGVMFGSYYDQYRKYCETLTALDRDLQRLLDRLDKLGISENTVIVTLSDNGMQWGTHDCHGIREPYEDAIRLPWIVRAPQFVSQTGTRRKQIALNLDLAPTLLELAGVSIPAGLDGQSLAPVLQNPQLSGRETFQLEFWRYFPENTPSYRGVRTRQYKYVEFDRGRKPWLFDLQNDPAELNNLYEQSESQAIQKELQGLLPPQSTI
jgi:N-acetylglucosamine-6-sulfatase